MNAAETDETLHAESGMRYQLRPHHRDPSSDRGFLVPVAGPGGVCIGHVRHDELAAGRQVSDRRVVHGSDAESRSDQLIHHGSADRSDADDGVEIAFWHCDSALGVRRPIWMPCGMP